MLHYLKLMFTCNLKCILYIALYCECTRLAVVCIVCIALHMYMYCECTRASDQLSDTKYTSAQEQAINYQTPSILVHKSKQSIIRHQVYSCSVAENTTGIVFLLVERVDPI